MYAALQYMPKTAAVIPKCAAHLVVALRGSDHHRATSVGARLDAQQKKLNLLVLPITIIGSFPQTIELRRVRRLISEEEYVKAIKEEIYKVVRLQEELDIDVLVHGEPEKNDMVEYFGYMIIVKAIKEEIYKVVRLQEELDIDVLVHGEPEFYGSRRVKPPIIYGDVSRPKAMTIFWSSMAQEITKRPMKGMLTAQSPSSTGPS
ncbi:5-methyltetrahydropteroyltriglutamate--homocysteine methyltransferase, partial [Tanacetum coccineum]